MGRQVDVDDLIDANQVAEVLGLGSRNAVSVYRHRHDDFPAPVFERPTLAIWVRGEVEAWSDSRSDR